MKLRTENNAITPSAAAIAEAVLGEAESPKGFFAHKAAINALKLEYELEDIGIDNSQYFSGRGTAYTDWQAVFVGIGDNPAESIGDALDQAAESGWDVRHINPGWPDHPSVAELYPDSEDLYYYSAVYVRKPGRTAESIIEAETPKSTFYAMRGTHYPQGWPSDQSNLRWRNWSGRWGRSGKITRAFVPRKKYRWDAPEGAPPEYYDFYYPRTYFHAHKDKESEGHEGETAPKYSIRYGKEHIVNYDRHGNTRIEGDLRSGAVRERIADFLHHGWHVTTYARTAYWWNDNWPQNIHDRLYFDMRNRKDTSFPWWIPVRNGDYLKRDGDLVFNYDRGLCKPDGSIKLGTQYWPALVKPSAGLMRPIRRWRRGYNPDQLNFQFESKYFRELDWIRRVRKKHAALKDAGKRQRDLDNIDKPDKRKKKKFNLH